MLAAPEAFISPKMWLQYGNLVQDLVTEHIQEDAPDTQAEQQSPEYLADIFAGHLEDIRRRNEAMLFRDLPPRVRGSLSSALADIKVSFLQPRALGSLTSGCF